MAAKRGRTIIEPGRRGAEGDRHPARRGHRRHHQPPALRPLRQPRPVPARPLSPAGPRDGLRHRPLHVPRAPAHPVRGGRRRGDGAQGVRRPRRRFTTATNSWRLASRCTTSAGTRRGCSACASRRGAGTSCWRPDATHLYAHINEGRVFPITYSVAETLEGYATIKRLADSPDHIIPGHDPQVLDRYPAARPGLENWVVRLDVEGRPGSDPGRGLTPTCSPGRFARRLPARCGSRRRPPARRSRSPPAGRPRGSPRA